MVKKTLLIAAAAALVIGTLCAAVPGLVHAQITGVLQGVFKGADVSVGELSIERPFALGVSDVEIQSRAGYRISVPKLTIDPALKLTLLSPRLTVRGRMSFWQTPEGSAEGSVSEKPQPQPARAFPAVVEARDLSVELLFPKLKTEIRGSVECDFRTRQVHWADLKAASLRSGALKIERIAVDLPASGKTGALTVGHIAWGKFKTSDLRSAIAWEETAILADPITASWAKGSVTGRARADAEKPFAWSAELEIRELDLDAFTDEFKLRDKMSATGRLAGKLSVQGDRSGILRLEGRLDAGSGGGDLVIRDPNFLKHLADNTRQPIELVEAAFKEYHFDTGSVALGKTDNSLNLAVNLEGDKGRRDFEVNLHDIL